MTPKELQQITYEDIRAWILDNSDDREVMDAINKLTYVFTSKYAERSAQAKQN